MKYEDSGNKKSTTISGYIKRIAIITTGSVIFILAAYIVYLFLSYGRIGDVSLEPEHRAGEKTGMLNVGETYDIMTYNIGFGAYQQDFDCVLDTSYSPDGKGGWKKVSGKHLKAFSNEDALTNTKGATNTVISYNPDFALIQEIDQDSDRCYHINQTDIFKNAFNEYDSTYAINFHTPFVCYPVNDMMGRATSGLLTLSRYTIQSASRHEFPVTGNIWARLFDLDRCFCENRIQTDNGRELVIINLHMSAYDKGGIIRQKQRELIYGFMQSEYEKGNYVIAGGDFNHDLLTNNPDYPQYDSNHIAFSENPLGKTHYSNVCFFDDNKNAGLPDAFRVVCSDVTGTCREGAIPWNPDVSLQTVLDGFVVSDNVEVNEITNIMTSTDSLNGYAYSDHQPAYMSFTLR